VQAIAEAVGIRKQSVLHHFPTKEELRRQVLLQLFAHWNDTLPRIFRDAKGGRDRIESIIRSVSEFLSEDPDRARLLLRELLDRPDEMRDLIRDYSREWTRLICDAIREAQAQGTVYPDVHPEAYVAHLSLSMVAGVGQYRVIRSLLGPGGNDDSIGAYIGEIIRIAKLGLFRPPRV